MQDFDVHFINYKGKMAPAEGKIMGPDLDGNYYVVTDQIYDENSNMSHLGLTKVDIEAYMQGLADAGGV